MPAAILLFTLLACNINAARAAEYGDEFHIGIDAKDFDPDSDVLQNTWGSIGLVSDIVYSELFKLTNSRELVGELASSCTMSPDKTVWEITLKPGIFFHDGSELMASDVKNTFDSVLDNPDSDYFDLFRFVSSIETTGKLSLRITFKKYDAFFAYALQLIPVTKPDSTKTSAVIGTGAYQFESYDSDSQTLTLMPHKTHFNHKPYLNRVVVHFLANHLDGLSRLARGELDFLYASDPAYEQLFANDRAYKIIYQKKPLYYVVDFNTKPNRMMHSKALRGLTAKLIDGRAIADVFSSLPDSIQIISYREHDFSSRILYQMLQSFYSFGVRLEPELESFPEFLERISASKFDLAIYPADFLFDDYYTIKLIEQKMADLDLTEDEKAVLHALRHELDDKKRAEALLDLKKIMADKVPFLVLLERKIPMLIHRRMKGYARNFSEVMDEVENMWVPREEQKYR